MMLIELIQVIKNDVNSYGLNKIYLNQKHIVFISEDRQMQSMLTESSNLGLSPKTTFSTIRINDGGKAEISVVGDPTMIEQDLSEETPKHSARLK